MRRAWWPGAEWLEEVRRTFAATRWAGATGCTLLVFAVCFDLSGNRALETASQAATAEARLLSRRLRAPGVPRDTPGRSLASFHAGFPAATELPDLLARVYGLAVARGVRVERTEYRSAVEAGLPLERVSLDLPASGAYPALRAWMGDLLAETPGLALESVALKRADMGGETLEAQLRVSLWLRKTP